MPPTSLEQLRARRAYSLTEYPDRAVSLPTMIQVNGLLSTWAFLLSKGDTELLRILNEHLWHSEKRTGNPPSAREMFLAWIGDGEGQLTGSHLRRLTAEALAFSVWLKRAAQAAGGD